MQQILGLSVRQMPDGFSLLWGWLPNSNPGATDLSQLISFSSFLCSSHSGLLSVPGHGCLRTFAFAVTLILKSFLQNRFFLINHVSSQAPSSLKGLPTLSCQKPTSGSMLSYFIYFMQLSSLNNLVYWHMCLPALECNVNSLRNRFLVLFPSVSAVFRTVPGSWLLTE